MTHMFKISMIRRSVAMAVTLACVATAAHADERESLEALKQTTLGLIEALVEQGVLPRAKADAMLAAAQQKAAAIRAASPAAPPVAADAKPGTIRVPYVPQAVKDQLRNEIREEVVAQARSERWGVPNSAAGWTDRIKIEGDLRLRHQIDTFGKDNSTVDDYLSSTIGTDNATRAADFNFYETNLSEQRQRLRLRARLDINAKVSDAVSTGLRLSTGSGTDRVSTNQTMGRDFNKYSIFLDRAYMKIEPTEWLSVSGGRIPNPWFNTDMVWSENLNFEGLAVNARWPEAGANGIQPFFTAGAFPIRDEAPPVQKGRWLYGLQVGANWQVNASTLLRFGVAQFNYKNLEGQVDNDYNVNGFDGAGTSYGQYQYGAGLRQKGNTVFFTNSPEHLDSTTGAPIKSILGLASKFQPITFTAAGRFAQFSPYSLLVSAEYVINPGYDQNEINKRIAASGAVVNGRNTGYQVKAVFGHPVVQQFGEWQVSAGYRWIGSDAVLDGFTDSDLGLGGTNLRGFTLGLQYGLDRNTSVGLRYLSARQIDPFSISGDTRFSADTFQVDLNVRF
jgi:Putative porin